MLQLGRLTVVLCFELHIGQVLAQSKLVSAICLRLSLALLVLEHASGGELHVLVDDEAILGVEVGECVQIKPCVARG